MSNVVEQLTPNPVTYEHGENGCCPDTRAWEMEMMHQVWAAGLHDAANCFQAALEAKWKLESQRKVKPKTNGDKIRAMTDEELVKILSSGPFVCQIASVPCEDMPGCEGLLVLRRGKMRQRPGDRTPGSRWVEYPGR